jgi:hypothetical protein
MKTKQVHWCVRTLLALNTIDDTLLAMEIACNLPTEEKEAALAAIVLGD